MAKDIRLDMNTHELVVEDFDLQLVDDIDRVQQQIRIRLMFFKGEWFLDLDFGVPWFQEILGVKPPPLSRAEALLREAILGTPDVLSIEAFSMDFVSSGRELSVSFRAKTNFGIVNIEEVFP